MYNCDSGVMNVNIDFNRINHAALMDGGCQLSASHELNLPAQGKNWKRAKEKEKLEKKFKHLAR